MCVLEGAWKYFKNFFLSCDYQLRFAEILKGMIVYFFNVYVNVRNTWAFMGLQFKKLK